MYSILFTLLVYFSLQSFGIDWSGPCACTVGDEVEVSVPRTACTLTDEEMAYLKQTVDPMDSCNDGGIGLYTAARCIVHGFCT